MPQLSSIAKPDPVSWMKVRWSFEKEIRDHAYRKCLADLVAKYGNSAMVVVSANKKKEGWMVTLSMGDNMLREVMGNLRTEIIRLNWMYLQPL